MKCNDWRFTFGFTAQFDGTAFGSHDVIAAAVGRLNLRRDDHSQVGHLNKNNSQIGSIERQSH